MSYQVQLVHRWPYVQILLMAESFISCHCKYCTEYYYVIIIIAIIVCSTYYTYMFI
jgi:hypothetical protein